MFPATIFDFNGVLVDDESVHLAAFRDVLTPLSIALTDEAYTSRYLGFDDVGAFRAILADAGRTPSDAAIAALVEAKRPFYRARAERELVVFEGAAALVAKCAAWGPVAIVSGALRDEIFFALGKMGIADRIGIIVSAEDTKRCKPDPEGYVLAVQELGRAAGFSPSQAERALAIEDSLAGVEAAKAAGLTCLAVAHSYEEDELASAGADATVARIAQIDEAMLRGLASRVL